MAEVFIATLGERPEAITIALDVLLERYDFDTVAIIHTSPQASSIGDSFHTLKRVFRDDYPQLTLRMYEVYLPDGAPLVDLTDRFSAEAYYEAVVRCLQAYKQDGYHVHLLVAGGRKAMSIYATLAAALIFNPIHDRVWTVLSPPEMVSKRGQFHVPKGRFQDVHLVDMPLITARLAPGQSADGVLERRQNPRQDFLQRLTPKQRELVEVLQRNPYASNELIAELRHVSPKTVENQLSDIYKTLLGFLDKGETVSNKRQALLDILREG